MRDEPTYDLGRIQRLVADGRYRITRSALRGAEHLGITPAGVEDATSALTVADFDKSMPAKKVPGLWQEVYRPTYAGRTLYLKLQVATDGIVVVVAFKQGR